MKARISLSLLLFAAFLGFAANAKAAEKRIALVVGEAAYAKPLPTAANDAGLIAQTLQAAGFDVSGARDLDEEGLRAALRDFVDKASQSGPETAAVIYFSGVGLQLEGENYLVPVNAAITRDSDIPLHAPRLSDYLKPLAGLGLKAVVVVLDAARESAFSLAGQPIAGGLAIFEPGPSALLAFNAAPGTIARDGAGPYGPYAHALAEMIRAGGMSVNQVFDETRLRVGEATKGAQIPWNSAAVTSSFVFFERTAGAPPRPDLDPSLQNQPLQQLGPEGAFAVALEKDTIRGYEDFLAIYPDDPLAKRVRALLAARREALYWRRARTLDTPEAYWSYLRRYPHGPHVADAERRLALRAAAAQPPQAFAPIDLGYPPPPPEEIVYVDRPVLYFGDPQFGFPPPPPPPLYLLPPPPPDFVVLPPPYVVAEPFLLPVPVFVPVPAYIGPPPYIAPPPGNLVFENIHNKIEIDHATNNFVVSSPAGHVLSSHALTAVGAVGAAAAIGVALPHVLKKAALPQGSAPPPGGRPASPLPLPASPPPTQPLGHAPPAPPAPGGKPALLAPVTPPAAPPAGGKPASLTPTQPYGHGAPPPAPPTPAAPQPKAHRAVLPPSPSSSAPPSPTPPAPQPKSHRAVLPSLSPPPSSPPPAPAHPNPAPPKPAAQFRAPPPQPHAPASPPAKHCVKVNNREVCR